MWEMLVFMGLGDFSVQRREPGGKDLCRQLCNAAAVLWDVW